MGCGQRERERERARESNSTYKPFINCINFAENIWLGGSDLQEENVWRWEHSHTSVAYQGWHDGQPDNDQNKEHCLGIDSGYNWKWNDMQCRYNFKYVCEMPVDNEI